MIIPFIMSLLTINNHPYLWYFYKSLDFAKKNNYPIIAQEKYFTKPTELLATGKDLYSTLIKNKGFVDRSAIYELPKDEDLDVVKKYPIPQEMEEKLVCEKGSINDAFAFALRERWSELEELLDRYFSEIENTYDEKISAVITLCWYPSLEYAAKKHNIQVINFEQGLFREPAYVKTAYFSFTSLFDDEKEIDDRYNNFKSTSDNLPILSRKEILSLMLTDDYLVYLKFFDQQPHYEAGVALGYATWMPFMASSYYNDEELLYNVSELYNRFTARRHPSDPTNATYPMYLKNPNRFANTIEFILSCKRIISIGSNVSLESAYWNRSPYTMIKCASSYGQKHDLADTEEYTIDDLYLNFFAFCFLIPYSEVMNPEYIEWRLSGPSEAEIFKKHLTIYLVQRSCDYEEFVSCSPEKRMQYILNNRGIKDLNKLEASSFNLFKNKTRIKNNNISQENIANIISENNALIKENNLHLETEKRYEAALFNMKAQNDSAADELNRLRTATKELQAQIDSLLANKNVIESDYNRIVNSTSWKITKPIRGLLDILRKHQK